MSSELFESIEQHNLSRLRELLATGVDPNIGHPDAPAWVPLKAAIEELTDNGPIEAVILLLQYGADVDGGREPGNATPLLVAAMNNQLEAVRLLLAAGADPQIRDDEGETPLGWSIQHQNPQVTELLRLCWKKAA